MTGVIVTRGNVPLAEQLSSILEVLAEVIVWDNGARNLLRVTGSRVHEEATGLPDLSVFGRYAALDFATTHPLVYVQDDDCTLEPASVRALIDAHEPGVIVANLPEPFRVHYDDSTLVGFGAVFESHLPLNTFARFDKYPDWEIDEETFYRCCDVVFTTLTPFVNLDVPYANLSFATRPDRMYRQPKHVSERRRTLELARRVRDAA